MKISLRSLTSLAALAGGVALMQFQTGCSATATRQSTGEYVDDATITTKVKAALVKDPVVKALDVQVETFKNTVQLSGFVDSTVQKARAEEIARGTNGVRDVTNNIQLKSTR